MTLLINSPYGQHEHLALFKLLGLLGYHVFLKLTALLWHVALLYPIALLKLMLCPGPLLCSTPCSAQA